MRLSELLQVCFQGRELLFLCLFDPTVCERRSLIEGVNNSRARRLEGTERVRGSREHAHTRLACSSKGVSRMHGRRMCAATRSVLAVLQQGRDLLGTQFLDLGMGGDDAAATGGPPCLSAQGRVACLATESGW